MVFKIFQTFCGDFILIFSFTWPPFHQCISLMQLGQGSFRTTGTIRFLTCWPFISICVLPLLIWNKEKKIISSLSLSFHFTIILQFSHFKQRLRGVQFLIRQWICPTCNLWEFLFLQSILFVCWISFQSLRVFHTFRNIFYFLSLLKYVNPHWLMNNKEMNRWKKPSAIMMITGIRLRPSIVLQDEDWVLRFLPRLSVHSTCQKFMESSKRLLNVGEKWKVIWKMPLRHKFKWYQ